MNKFIYTFDIFVGYTDIRRLTNTPFSEQIVIKASTNESAIKKIKKYKATLGEKLLEKNELLKETEIQYKQRVGKEFNGLS